MSDEQFTWLLVMSSTTFFILSVICAIGAYIMIFGGAWEGH